MRLKYPKSDNLSRPNRRKRINQPFEEGDLAIPETLGQRLARAKRKRSVSNQELAKVTDVHPNTVSKWLSDVQTPDAEALDILARTLGVTTTWLLHGDNAPALTSESMARLSVAEASRLEYSAQPLPPRVALGIPQRIRVWLQEFLLELTKVGVSGEEIDGIRRILSADELYRYYAGGDPKEYSEDETLEGIQAHAEAFRRDLRRRGYKLPK